MRALLTIAALAATLIPAATNPKDRVPVPSRPVPCICPPTR